MARAKRSRRRARATLLRGGPRWVAFARPRRMGAIFVLLAILGAAPAAGLLARSLAFGGSTSEPRTAVIVDQLSLTQPNPAFIETATDTLEGAGYTVDYFPGEEVTVDFYRNLPTHGYDLVILRVHGGRVMSEDGRRDYVGLFTSEPYSETGYLDDHKAQRLVISWYYEGSPAYFGILPHL